MENQSLTKYNFLCEQVAREFYSLTPVKEVFDLDDLIQAGFIGLCKANEKFDTKKGQNFVQYARWWVQQSIRETINRKNAIKVPANMLNAYFKLKKTQDALLEQGLNPSFEEICKEAGLPLSSSKKAWETIMASNPVSLNVEAGNDSKSKTSECMDLIENTQALNPESTLIQQEDNDCINNAVKSLTQEQQIVIQYLFGLNNHPKFSEIQLAERLNKSLSEILDIKQEAIRQLYANDDIYNIYQAS